MSEIVGRPCREHRNIGALLDMLERMLDGLESGSDAPGDIGLMRDISRRSPPTGREDVTRPTGKAGLRADPWPPESRR